MGFWGWPLQQNDAVLRTCRAALAVRAEFEATEGFQAGIGVATGRAVAGKIGTVDQVKVTVFGPVVNLASRLEGMTKLLRAPILLDEATARLVRGQVPREVARVRRLAIVRPYGLDAPLEVSELLPPVSQHPELSDDHLGMLRGGARCVSRPPMADGAGASAPYSGGRRGQGFSGGLHRRAQPPPAERLGRGDSVGGQVGRLKRGLTHERPEGTKTVVCCCGSLPCRCGRASSLLQSQAVAIGRAAGGRGRGGR